MEAHLPPFNVEIVLGDDHQQEVLGEIKLQTDADKTMVDQTRQTAKLQDAVGEDFVAVLHLHVYQGREKEAHEYVLEALDNKIVREKMSPLQQLLRRPEEEEGNVSVRVEPGLVIVTYRNFSAAIDYQLKVTLLDRLEKFSSLQASGLLKGTVSHKKNNRTTVKVDYSKCRVSSDHLDTPLLVNLIRELSLCPQEIASNPTFLMLGKAKRINLALKFASYRQMVAYGRAIETENDHPVEKSDKEFNYVNKGLFRANAEVFLMYADKISATISVTYHSEDVLMRLTKVYFQAVKRTFDL